MAKQPKIFIEHMDMISKQSIEHVNEFPSDLSKINKVQSVIKTYQNDKLPKTDNIDEFLKRKPRYEFNVFLKTTEHRNPSHRFIFDNESDAIKAYKQCISIMIDELIEPYRNIVKSGKQLTEKQIIECKRIQDMLPED